MRTSPSCRAARTSCSRSPATTSPGSSSTSPRCAERARAIARTGLTVAVPAALWIGAVAVVAGGYRWQTALLLNGVTGADHWTDDWQFWFLEALVWGNLVIAGLVALPWLDRWQRARPFAAAILVLLGCLAVRYALVGVEAGQVERYSTVVVLWCVALGWAAGAATNHRHQPPPTGACRCRHPRVRAGLLR